MGHRNLPPTCDSGGPQKETVASTTNRAWILDFNLNKGRNDLLSASQYIFSLVVLGVYKQEFRTGGPFGYIVFAIGITSVVAYLSAQSNPWYFNNRSAILSCYQIAIVIASGLVYGTPAYAMIHPVELPGTVGGWIRCLLIIPALTYQVLMTHVTPSNWKRIVGASTLLTSFVANFFMCRDELKAIPQIAQYYIRLVTSAETLFSKLFPFPNANVVSKTGTQFFATGLDDLGSCMTVHSILQIGVGYLLPMSILLAEEAISQNIFEMEYHNDFQFIHHHSIITIYYLLMALFETILTFQATVQTIHLVTWAFS